MYVALLVEAYRRQGRIERGLETLAEAFATADTNGMTYWDAELHRLKGDFALARGDGAEAEHCYHHAIALAQGQNAKSLELRAAMRLARLWADRDRREEARERLAPLYAWFTEGFDTADLKDAKALLDELA